MTVAEADFIAGKAAMKEIYNLMGSVKMENNEEMQECTETRVNKYSQFSPNFFQKNHFLWKKKKS